MSSRPLRRIVARLPGAQQAYRAAIWGRMRTERWALAQFKRPVPGQGRILAYHAVGTPSWGGTDVSPRDFEHQLQAAVDDGWSFATPAQIIADPRPRRLAITFDDGVRSVLDHAVPVLRHHGVPATAFIVTGWADGNYRPAPEAVLDWPGVRALLDAGLTLGSHSVTHPDFGRLDADATRRELVQSRQRLQAMTGVDVTEFAFPLGQSRNWSATASRLAEEAGYTTVYAQAVNTRSPGTVPRTFITRFDHVRLFRAALAGAFDNWDQWY